MFLHCMNATVLTLCVALDKKQITKNTTYIIVSKYVIIKMPIPCSNLSFRAENCISRLLDCKNKCSTLATLIRANQIQLHIKSKIACKENKSYTVHIIYFRVKRNFMQEWYESFSDILRFRLCSNCICGPHKLQLL